MTFRPSILNYSLGTLVDIFADLALHSLGCQCAEMEARRAETADRQFVIDPKTGERRASVCVDMDVRRLMH